ncbi:MAG TPA: hypothetical protein DEB10_10640 [Ruminococcaceae bacterium]|nr:hypothetical protein [Oscillospiraceae bacterium]
MAFFQIQYSSADCHSVLNMVCVRHENVLYCVVNAVEYDTETGFYSLHSRYYDPEIGRFINADDTDVMLEHLDDSILATNLYAYCLNNPVFIILRSIK